MGAAPLTYLRKERKNESPIEKVDLRSIKGNTTYIADLTMKALGDSSVSEQERQNVKHPQENTMLEKMLHRGMFSTGRDSVYNVVAAFVATDILERHEFPWTSGFSFSLLDLEVLKAKVRVFDNKMQRAQPPPALKRTAAEQRRAYNEWVLRVLCDFCAHICTITSVLTWRL